MRIRKNIDCLSTNELHTLRETLAEMYTIPADNPDSYHRLASLHGGPPQAYCEHGTPGFLTWHRAYLLAFEDAMQKIDCDVTLPYWDWSSGPSIGIPYACREPTYVNRNGLVVPNPLYAGPSRNGGLTVRGPSADTVSFEAQANDAQAALQAPTLSQFQQLINGPHGMVHVKVGGDMGSVPTAGFDPLFWLHHANVDRLWAKWQASHTHALPASEQTLALEPFNQTFTTQWKTGAQMASTTSLGYTYRTWCFILPPFKVFDPILVEIKPWIRERLQSANLVIKADRMQSEPIVAQVFVSARGSKKEILAGELGFMGHPGEEHETVRLVAANEGSHGHDHAHGHSHGDSAETVATADGQMLVRARTQRAATVHPHGTPGHRHYHKAVELSEALRALPDDVEQVQVTVKAHRAGGGKLRDDEFHNTGLELSID